MLELTDENFKALIINTFKVLTETMFKELKENGISLVVQW